MTTIKKLERELHKAIKQYEKRLNRKLTHKEKEAYIDGWYDRYATIYGV